MQLVPATDHAPQDIYTLLFRLGGTLSVIGYYYAAEAVIMCIQQPDRLLMITKLVYPVIAKEHHTNWQVVERNLRNFISVAWKTNPELLSELAQRPLSKKPTPKQFIAIVSTAVIRSRVA